jgi:hypothetical protein
MTKTIAIVVVVLLLAPFALASDTETSHGYRYSLMNEYLNHTHTYDQTSSYKAPLGYGVDLTLYEMDIANVGVGLGVDAEYDQNNGVFGCFAKVRVNTTQLINKLIGK